MARLPGPLKRKSEDADLAQRLRAENLTRLRMVLGAAMTPAPVAGRDAVEGAVEQAGAREPARAGHAEVAAPDAASGTEEVERLRSRVSTSEGMLRAENDRHRQAEDAWRRREAELLERMSVVQRQAAVPLSADELRRYVTPQQLQEFGEEHCRFLVETVRAASG